MATHHGKEGDVLIGAVAVAEVTGWEYSENARLQEDTAITDSAATYKGGITDGGGSIDCFWDPTNTNGQNLLRAGSSVELHVCPTGNTASEIEFTGTVTVEEMRVTGSRDGMITATFSFKGVLTEGAI